MTENFWRTITVFVACCAGLVAIMWLSGCTPAPEQTLPVPPAPPVTARNMPIRTPALQSVFAEASARLRAYRDLPQCAGSGPVDCYDPVVGRRLAAAERQARTALAGKARQPREVRLARARIHAFAATVERMTAKVTK